MSKLENIYGLRLHVDDDLEPLAASVLQERVAILQHLKRIQLEEFNVYYHVVTVENQSARHFSKRFCISERLEWLDLIFEVNPKQQTRGDIEFFNCFVQQGEQTYGVQSAHGHYRVVNRFRGIDVEQNSILKTELITFVRNGSIRNRHRKIKLSVTPQPTESYSQLLREKADFDPSEYNIPLRHEIQIRTSSPTASKTDLKLLLQKPVHADLIDCLLKLNDHPLSIQINQLMDNSQTFNNNQNQVGAQGSHVERSTFQNIQNGSELTDTNYDELQKELTALRLHLDQYKDPNKGEHYAALGSVIQAQKAVEQKDEKETKKLLKSAGKWAFDAATAIGTKLAASLIAEGMK